MNSILNILPYRRIVSYRLAKNIFGLIRSSSSIENKISLDLADPAVQQYLEHVRATYGSQKSKANLRPLCLSLEKRASIVENLRNLEELQSQDKDGSMKDLVKQEKELYETSLKNIDEEVLSLLVPKEMLYGFSECIVEIMAGVGGQEAMLFAKDLTKMYIGYALYRKWNVETAEESLSELGGIRRASLHISGSGAYEIMCMEAGVHRVQRVPATEKAGRLHTSTVSVAVMLQPTEIEIQINDLDLRIETKRSSGAGGQHVNTTDSCVRILHIPTGVMVECQVERDQHKNKRMAMTRLRALLYQRKLDEQNQKERDEKKSQIGSGLRNEKIRTYNFNQDRVTDHRLGAASGSIHDLDGVLKGGAPLDLLIGKLLNAEYKQKVFADIESFRLKLEQTK